MWMAPMRTTSSLLGTCSPLTTCCSTNHWLIDSAAPRSRDAEVQISDVLIEGTDTSNVTVTEEEPTEDTKIESEDDDTNTYISPTFNAVDSTSQNSSSFNFVAAEVKCEGTMESERLLEQMARIQAETAAAADWKLEFKIGDHEGRSISTSPVKSHTPLRRDFTSEPHQHWSCVWYVVHAEQVCCCRSPRSSGAAPLNPTGHQPSANSWSLELNVDNT